MKFSFKQFRNVLFSVMVFLVMTSVVLALESERLGKNDNRNINFHGTCRNIINNGGQNEYFIPAKTLAEWNAFLNNKPQDVSINIINGGWSPTSYSAWGACSASCGGGTQSRTATRSCDNPSPCGGSGCSGSSSWTETQACNTHPCPVNCAGYWNLNAGSCSRSCGGGFYDKQWVTTTAPAYGGTPCPSPSFIDNGGNSCNTQPCPINCAGYWNLLAGSCSKTCGTGFYDKQFVMTTAPAYGGTACPSPSFIDNGGYACNTQPCCVPESDASFCARFNLYCSPPQHVERDNCGNWRSVNCGTCPPGTNCAWEGGVRKCLCVVTSWSPDPSGTCSYQTLTQTSNCGTTRTVNGTKSCPPPCNVALNWCFGNMSCNDCRGCSDCSPGVCRPGGFCGSAPSCPTSSGCRPGTWVQDSFVGAGHYCTCSFVPNCGRICN